MARKFDESRQGQLMANALPLIMLEIRPASNDKCVGVSYIK
jgi:hypothetical protein